MGALLVIAAFMGVYLSLALLPKGRAAALGLIVAAAMATLSAQIGIFAPLIWPAFLAIGLAAIAQGLRQVLGQNLAPWLYRALLGLPPLLAALVIIAMMRA
jgi:hypothetical protein